MPRWLYCSFMILAVLLGGSLVALPLWDHWYYGKMRVSDSPAAAVAPDAADGDGLPSASLVSDVAALSRTPARLEWVAIGKRGSSSLAPVGTPILGASRSAPAMGEGRTTEATMTTLAAMDGARTRSPGASSPPTTSTGASETRGPDGRRAAMAAGGFFPWAGPSGTAAGASSPLPPRGDGPASTRPANEGENHAGDDNGAAPSDTVPMETPRVVLVPVRNDLSAGQTFVVKVAMIGGRNVSSVPFHLSFNPEVLQFVGAREGSAFHATSLAPLLLAGVNPDRPGDLAVGLSLIRSAGLLSASGDLLELEFMAVGPGEADLGFERASLRGARGETLSAEFLPAAVTVR